MPNHQTLPGECQVCGNRDSEFVVLAWKSREGDIQKRRYCASWISPSCYAQYERAADAVGF